MHSRALNRSGAGAQKSRRGAIFYHNGMQSKIGTHSILWHHSRWRERARNSEPYCTSLNKVLCKNKTDKKGRREVLVLVPFLSVFSF